MDDGFVIERSIAEHCARSITSLIASRIAAAPTPRHAPARTPTVTPTATIAMSQMIHRTESN